MAVFGMTAFENWRLSANAERCLWVALAALVIVLCSIRLAAAPGMEFYVGPVVYLTILRFFGLRAGLAAAALVMAPSIIWWGHPFTVLFALAHVLFVNRVGRKFNNVDATALFVVCIQVPLGWLVLQGLYHPPNPVIAFELIRKLLNDLCCAALVDFLLTRVAFDRLTGRFVRAGRSEIGIYLRAVVHLSLVVMFTLVALMASRNFLTRLALERAVAREDVAAHVAGLPELALSLAPLATAPEGKRPGIEFALSPRADDLAAGSPTAKALGCSVVGAFNPSATVRFDAVLRECEVHRVHVAEAPTYALINYRQAGADAYAWILLNLSLFLGAGIAWSLLTLGFQRAIARTVSRWRTIVSDLGTTHLSDTPASGPLEFAEPTDLFVETNNRLVAILEEGRQATAALHIVQADLGLKLLENIIFHPGEGYIEFNEVFSKSTSRVSLNIRCPVNLDLLSYNGDVVNVSVELQIIGEEGDRWYQLILENLRPDGKYSSGLLYRMGEPTALINLLAQENRMSLIGMQSSVIAHEIRQPIFTMSLIAERLRLTLENSGRPTKAQLIKDIEAIEKSANTVIKLVSLKNRFDRPEIDGDNTCDPVTVIEDSAAFWSPIFVREGVNLVFEQIGPKGYFFGLSTTKLQQILTNLIKNAYEAIQERQINVPLPPALITITLTYTEGAYASIVCSDNGTGIRRGDEENIFTQFHSTKDRALGSGLGLFISRAILHRAGGMITARNQDGLGSAFELTLPLAPAVKT